MVQVDSRPGSVNDEHFTSEQSDPRVFPDTERSPLIVQRRRLKQSRPRSRRMTLAVPYPEEDLEIWGELNDYNQRARTGSRSSSHL